MKSAGSKILVVCESSNTFTEIISAATKSNIYDFKWFNSTKNLDEEIIHTSTSLILIHVPSALFPDIESFKTLAIRFLKHKIIILSTSENIEDAVKFIKAGAEDYLNIETFKLKADEILSQFHFSQPTANQISHHDTFLLGDARFNYAFEAIRDNYWEYRAGKLLISDNWQKKLSKHNTDFKELTFSEWRSLIHPDDIELVEHEIKQLHEKYLQEYAVEYRIRKSNDSFIWVRENGKVIERTADNNPIQLVGTFTDITERKTTHFELQEKDSIFKLISDNMPVGIFEITTKGYISYTNTIGLQWFGYKKEDFINKVKYADCIISEDHGRLKRKFQEIIAKGISATGEYTAKRFDGSNFDLLLTAYCLLEEGQIKGLRAVAIDITKRKTAEKKLQAQNQALEETAKIWKLKTEHLLGLNRAIIENVNIAVVSVTKKGTILSFNPAAEKLLGYTPEEVIGLPDPYLFLDKVSLLEKIKERGLITSHQSIPDFSEHIEKILPGLPPSFEWMLKHKDGRIIPVIFSISSLYDDRGETTGYVGLAIDNTERKIIEQKIIKSENRFHEMFESHDAMMFLVEPESGIVIDANKSARNFYGYDFTQTVNVKNINTKPANELAAEMVEASKHERNYFIFNHRLANGEVRSVDIHSTPIEINNKTLLFSIIRDITDKQIAENKLLATTMRLNGLIENMQLGILFEDENRKVALVNQAFCTIFKINAPPEALLGFDCDLAAQASAPLFKQPEDFLSGIKKIISSEKLVSGEEVEFADGLVFERDYIPITNDGKLTGHLWKYKDITDKKVAERALSWNESLLRFMANSSPLAFYISEAITDEILYFNSRFCELWGLKDQEQNMRDKNISNSEIISKCALLLESPDDFITSCLAIQEEGNQSVIDDVIHLTDKRIISRYSTQIRSDKNEYYGRLFIFEDISTRIQNENFLRQQRDLAVGLSLAVSLSEMLDLAINTLVNTETVDFGGIYLLNKNNDEIKLEAYCNLTTEIISSTRVYKKGEAQFEKIMAGKSVYGSFNNTISQKNIKNYKHNSAIAIIPLLNKGNVIGSLNFGSDTLNVYSAEQQQRFETFASQIGIAISRFQAEEALRSSQQNFELMFHTLDDFIFILDMEGNIIKTNPVVEMRLGYTSEELANMHVLHCHPPERRDEAGKIVAEMLAGNAVFCPVPLYAKNGSSIPVETRVILGKWNNKDALYGISRDISERIKAEESLKESEDIFQQFMKNSPIYVFFKDENTRALRLSYNYEQFLGKPINELLGKTPEELFPPEMAARINNEDRKILENGEKIELEEEINGRFYSTTKFPIISKNKTSYLAGYTIDITERKKAEKELMLRETYLSAVINNHPGMFWLKDTKGKFLMVNHQNALYLNKNKQGDPGSVVGHTDFDFISKEESEKYLIEDQYVIENLQPLIVEECDGNNNERWYEKFKYPVLDNSGKVIGVSGYSIDITERKKAEFRLKMQNAAFESFSLAMMIADVEGNIQWINPAFTKLTGYTQSEIIGKNPSILHSGKQSKEFYRNLLQTIEAGKVWTNELINRRKDGSLYYEEETITPVLNEAGKILSYIAIKIDISHRKEIEKALHMSEERWKFAVEGSGDGIWDWNALTNQVYFSKQWKAMLGYEVDDISSSLNEWSDRVHPEDKEDVYAELNKHMAGETTIYVSEHRMLCKDGSYKWVLDRGKVIEWIDKIKPVRIIGTHTDITARKTLEESLKKGIEKEKELNDLKSRFVSTASHEFRTPLASILILSESLIAYWKRMEEDQIKSRLDKIKEQTFHLTNVVNDVLQLSKIQEGKIEIRKEIIDIVELCMQTVERFNTGIQASKQVKFSSNESIIMLALDKRLIQQSIDNLLSNAIKYAPVDPEILFWIEADQNTVKIHVKDNGIGIPEEDQKHLFTPFFRATNTKTIQGNGLGLNIVRESIRLMNGDVTFESSSQKGSCFSIRLLRSALDDNRKTISEHSKK